jgi:molybdopterin-guanine dinucleotide biosynthesis protein MobB
MAGEFSIPALSLCVTMRRLHIVGGKNQGKTTLVVNLVAEATRRGLSVGTIKHTHHHHELDVPGKDSHAHREAGAKVVGILTPALNAAFWTTPAAQNDAVFHGDARYEQFAAIFSTCDFVLVEGDSRSAAPKLEVWRAANGVPPMSRDLSNVLAIVTDDPLSSSTPTISRSDVTGLVNFILQSLDRPHRAS